MIGSMRTRYSEDEVAVRDAFFDFFANSAHHHGTGRRRGHRL